MKLMADYDFTTLAPADFEDLTHDLLQRHLNKPLQSFTNGRDKGIDLRHAPSGEKDCIVQCKHFAGSGYAKLKSHLKRKELPKITKLSPSRYILATSVGLTPGNVDDLFVLLQPFCRSKHDIFGRDDLNALLRENPDVEKAHVKLWLTSEAVLSRALHNDVFVQSSLTEQEIRQRLSLYVYTATFDTVRSRLEKDRVCMISGVPGVGKTTLAEIVLLEYLMKDWQLVTIRQNVSEGLRAFQDSPRAKQVFYYDDFLGQISRGEKLAKNEDRLLLQLIHSVASTPRKRFVLTTREYILAQAKAEHEQLARSNLDVYRFVVNCEEYTEYEKARILANHLYFYGVPQDHIAAIVDGAQYRKIISHRNYNPRIIEWMTGVREVGASPASRYPAVFLERLENPSELWKHAFDRQLSEASRNLLLVLASCGEAVLLSDLQEAFEAFYSQRGRALGLSKRSTDFRDSLNELEGNFVRIHQDENRRVVQFHNPSILDFLRDALRERTDELWDLLHTAVFFEQVERLSLVFEIGRNLAPGKKDVGVAVSDSINRTFAQKAIGLSKMDLVGKHWRSTSRNEWERLRACIQICNTCRSVNVETLVIRLVRQSFEKLSQISGELTNLASVFDMLAKCDWCEDETLKWCHSQIEEYLLDRRTDFEESLDGLSCAASWVMENCGGLAQHQLVESLATAVTKVVESELSENDPERLNEALDSVKDIAKALRRDFSDEVASLESALSECPSPDDDRYDDWRDHRAEASCTKSIESLFESLLD